jgi:hypothetical protein
MINFKRDIYHGHRWSGYVPVGSDGNYIRYDFASPRSNSHTVYATYFDRFIMQTSLYGKSYSFVEYMKDSSGWNEGQLNHTARGSGQALWEAGGVWADGSGVEYTDNVWGIRSGDNVTSGNFERASLKVEIPANSNRISIIVAQSPDTTGEVHALWDGDDFTDELWSISYTTEDALLPLPKVVNEYVIDSFTPKGVATDLVIHQEIGGGVKPIFIVGVRAWDTNVEVAPESGGEIIDAITTIGGYATADLCGTNGRTTDSRRSVSGFSTQLAKPYGTLETTWRWRYTGTGAYKWTGGSAHFGPDQADYTYHFGEYATGPTISVDGEASDEAWDDIDNPLGTILSGNSILIQSTGFADYSEEGTEGATEPDIEWGYLLTAGGLRVWHNITFRADTEIDVGYDLMWPCVPPLQEDTVYKDIASLSYISPSIAIPDSIGIDILKGGVAPTITLSPLSKLKRAHQIDDKFYCNRVHDGEFSGSAAATFESGDTLSLGGEFIIKDYLLICSNRRQRMSHV